MPHYSSATNPTYAHPHDTCRSTRGLKYPLTKTVNLKTPSIRKKRAQPLKNTPAPKPPYLENTEKGSK